LDCEKVIDDLASVEGREEAIRNLLPQEAAVGKRLKPSLYLPTPSEIRIPIAVPAESDLYFSVFPWICPGLTGTLTYEITCQVKTGGRVEKKVLFRQEMASPPDPKAEWATHRIPLDEFAGKTVEFSFITRADTSPHCSIPAYFGSPRVFPRAESAKPNIVLVAFDTQRADHLGCYGYGRDVSPNVDRLAREGMRFDMCESPSSWTLPSFVSMFTGSYSRSLGLESIDFALPQNVRTLAGTLAEEGYTTAGIVSNPFLHPWTNLHRGFEDYEIESYNFTPDAAKRVTDSALKYLSGPHPEPFFLFVHYIDPHMPVGQDDATAGRFTQGYEGPVEPDFFELNGNRFPDPEDRRFVVGLYDGDVGATDREFGRLLDGIRGPSSAEDPSLGGNTIVVFMSDHGEEYWDHGGRSLGFECKDYERGLEHGHTFYQELVHVPLIVRYPDIVPAGSVCSKPVSLLDIAPTLLDLAGIDPEVMGARIHGISLSETLRYEKPPPWRTLYLDSPLTGLPKLGMVEYPWKMVHHLATGQSELFDLAKDPGEKQNLAAANWRKSEAMMDRILEFNRQACRRGRSEVIEIRAFGDTKPHQYECTLSSREETKAPRLAFPAAVRRRQEEDRYVLEISFASDRADRPMAFSLEGSDSPIDCVLRIDGKADPGKVYCGPAKDHPGEFPFRLDLLPTGFRKPETEPTGPGWAVWMNRNYYELKGAPRGEASSLDDEALQHLRAMNYVGNTKP
jgi:arylsulfatase A-like enzyme